MKRTLAIRRFALCVALAGGIVAAQLAGHRGALEQRLREQRPDVVRWQVHADVGNGRRSTGMPRIADVGRIGARTAGALRGRTRALVRRRGFRAGAGERARRSSAAPLRAPTTPTRGARCAGAWLRTRPNLDATRRWRATRRLAAGDALCALTSKPRRTSSAIAPVTLNAHRGAVSASRVLTAAADAQLGERVRLRDRASGAVVVAIVTGPGAARLSEEQE